ncbi:hypothetical protein PPYR_13168 [Photinus pyralis]|uniref:DUF4485 domain-containing protein n=1 Tax=Photinus pyralis TaxID=7054 RepID=A0A1Y1LWJ5_PHOPY|nr:uncharacterized protein LOC116178789 [Photinus pyralis]KAB0793548.1 hypothetical protein PPYR_13168 [Photinus pyralis]
MADVAEDLNYDCNYNMFLTKTMMGNLTAVNDREKVVRWMRKLATCNRTLAEMRLRNDFMYYLVLNVQNGELRPPFTENPPQGPLPALAHLLPGGAEAAGDEGAWIDSAFGKQKPMLYQHSPDGGAFLAAQPIPRCGAFCYLAVVSRAKP